MVIYIHIVINMHKVVHKYIIRVLCNYGVARRLTDIIIIIIVVTHTRSSATINTRRRTRIIAKILKIMRPSNLNFKTNCPVST